MENLAYLLTGGNVGNRKKNLEKAAEYIESEVGQILQRSHVYETEAWGNTSQPSFYNQVLLVATNSDADQLMKKILETETKMGRVRTIKNASRIIDIDILFFNDETIETDELTVPHKEIANRKFVLLPLQEIAPGYLHPVFQKNISELLRECNDPLGVQKLHFT